LKSNTLFYKQYIFKIIVLLLFSVIPVVHAVTEVKPKSFDITITKGDIYINNTKLHTPATIDELNLLLGQYNRSKSTSMTWDSVGITVLNDKDVSGDLKIYIKKRTPFEEPKVNSFGRHVVDSRPIHDFSGKLIIDGFKITKETTLTELNKSRRGYEFTKDALYNTYSQSYSPNSKNKSFICSTYIKITNDNKIYQVVSSCFDWGQYKTKGSLNGADIETSKSTTVSKLYQEKYNLTDKQVIEFEKHLAKYKAKKQDSLFEKAKIIEEKYNNGELTEKQVERAVMKMMYPNMTAEKIAEQNKARQALENNKGEMSKKDQAAAKAGSSLMMLNNLFGNDDKKEAEIQKIADQVKQDYPDTK